MSIRYFIVLAILFSLHYSTSVLAQAPSCETAILVCEGAPTREIPVSSDSIIIPNDLLSTCGFGEISLRRYTEVSVPHQWFKFQMTGGGELAFTIRPDSAISDIDFVAYRTTDGSCETAVAERCMFSGRNVNDSLGSIRCIGPTGLRAIEVDSFEGAGCSPSNNNFLQSMVVEAGEVIYLLVIASAVQLGYQVEYTGTATLSCSTSSTFEFSGGATTSLYPNPTSGVFKVTSTTALVQILVHDVAGRPYLKQAIPLDKTVQVNSADWPKGTYFVSSIDERGNRNISKISIGQ